MKRTNAQLIAHHLKQAEYWDSQAKSYTAKALVAREKAARMIREAKETAEAHGG
jgi:hypothetical protein